MLTATGAGTPRKSTRMGTVMVPAPTPVSVMNSAMMNPMRYCIEGPRWTERRKADPSSASADSG